MLKTLKKYMSDILIYAAVVALAITAAVYDARAEKIDHGPSIVCMSSLALRDLTYREFEEELKFRGLNNDGTLLEIYMSKNGDTYTLAITDIDGRSCIIGAGQYFGDVKPKVRGNPA